MAGKPQKHFKKEWSARKIATVSVYAALGYRSQEIADILGDGTSAASIRHQVAQWGVYDMASGDGKKRVGVRMHPKAVQAAADLAEEMGIPFETWAGRVVEFAARGGLYDAIVDGDGEAYESE